MDLFIWQYLESTTQKSQQFKILCIWEFGGGRGEKEIISNSLMCNNITKFTIFKNVWLPQYLQYSFNNVGTTTLYKVKHGFEDVVYMMC